MVPKELSTWPQLITHLLSKDNHQLVNGECLAMEETLSAQSSLIDKECLALILQSVFSHSHYSSCSSSELQCHMKGLVESLCFFDLIQPLSGQCLDSEKSVFDNLVKLMSSKLVLKEGEKDAVVLYTAVKY